MSGAVWEYGGAIVSWRCKQQSTVATSPMQAELIALTEGAKEGMYLRKLVQSMGEIGPTTLFVDNAAALTNANDVRITQGNKHIEIRHFYIRELVEQRMISDIKCYFDASISAGPCLFGQECCQAKCDGDKFNDLST